MLSRRINALQQAREPLYDAILSGTAEDVAQALRSWRQHPDNLFQRGSSPLWLAIHNRGRAEWTDWEGAKIIHVLAEAGVTINDRDHYQCTPLHYVHSPEMAEALIECGADLSALNEFGDKPLFMAIQANKVNVVRVLLNAGAETNGISGRGRSALQVACTLGLPDIVMTLLRRNVDTRVMTYDSESILHLAVRSCSRQTVRILLEHGVDQTVRNNIGITAEDYAKEVQVMENNPCIEVFDLYRAQQANRLLSDVGASVSDHAQGRRLFPEDMSARSHLHVV